MHIMALYGGVHALLGLALADFGRDPRSSDSWRAMRNFFSLSIKATHDFIHQFPIGGQISRN